MNNILIKFICLVICLLLVYFSVILCLKHFRHTSWDEAHQLTDQYIYKILDCFRSTEKTNPAIQYDVFIGGLYPGTLSPREDLVEERFYKLNMCFDDYYYVYSYMSTSGNMVIYQFRAYYPVDANRHTLLRKTRRIAERCLLKHWHDMGVYNCPPIDNFVAINLYGCVLNICYACNEAGFAEIAEMRKSPH